MTPPDAVVLVVSNLFSCPLQGMLRCPLQGSLKTLERNSDYIRSQCNLTQLKEEAKKQKTANNKKQLTINEHLLSQLRVDFNQT
jgi:hypothetical protein